MHKQTPYDFIYSELEEGEIVEFFEDDEIGEFIEYEEMALPTNKVFFHNLISFNYSSTLNNLIKHYPQAENLKLQETKNP